MRSIVQFRQCGVTSLKFCSRYSSNSEITELPDKSITQQAPNRAQVWSKSQEARSDVTGPRFIDINMEEQPRPLAAIELLKNQPVIMVESRSVSCDGGGLLGHPKVFINLDDHSKPSTCGYCGNRFQQKEHSHH